jgi:hypothetical protein
MLGTERIQTSILNFHQLWICERKHRSRRAQKAAKKKWITHHYEEVFFSLAS